MFMREDKHKLFKYSERTDKKRKKRKKNIFCKICGNDSDVV